MQLNVCTLSKYKMSLLKLWLFSWNNTIVGQIHPKHNSTELRELHEWWTGLCDSSSFSFYFANSCLQKLRDLYAFHKTLNISPRAKWQFIFHQQPALFPNPNDGLNLYIGTQRKHKNKGEGKTKHKYSKENQCKYRQKWTEWTNRSKGSDCGWDGKVVLQNSSKISL